MDQDKLQEILDKVNELELIGDEFYSAWNRGLIQEIKQDLEELLEEGE